MEGIVFFNSASFGLNTCGRIRGAATCAANGTTLATDMRIRNNIFADNHTGMYVHYGTGIEVAGNLFVRNGLKGIPNNTAIYADDGANGVDIHDNEFREDRNALSLVLGVTSAGAPLGEDVSFTGNRLVNDQSGANFKGVDGLTVSDNTLEGGTGGGLLFQGSGNRDITVEGNRITGKGVYGISFEQQGKPTEPQNTAPTLVENTILDSGVGIRLQANSTDGTATLARNRIVDNAGGGLINRDPNVIVDAGPNWWGCNLGPGFTGCDTVTSPNGGTTPVVTPWLTLSLAATPAELDAGAGSSLLARLANLSTGALADGPVLPRGPRRVRLAACRRHLRPADHASDHARACGHDRLHRRIAPDRVVGDCRPRDRADLQHRPARARRDPRHPPSRPHAPARAAGGDRDRAHQPRYRDRPPSQRVYRPVGEARPQRGALPADRAGCDPGRRLPTECSAAR